MNIEYLDLDDYIGIASEILGPGEETVGQIASRDLADPALHAPSASPTSSNPTSSKAAVLIVRLAKNHPLPDGNKRVAL